MNKYKNKKLLISNKNIIIAILFVISFTIFYLCLPKEYIYLDKNEMTVEYGEFFKLDYDSFVDRTKTSHNVLSQIIMDTSSLVNEKDKDYPAVGEYIITLSYKEERHEVRIIVEDRTAPKFTEDFKSEITFTKNCIPSDEELAGLYKVSELSDVTVTVDDSGVDYSKPGAYEAKVIAEDSSGNRAEKDVTIKITEAAIVLNKTEVILTVDSSTVLVADVKEKVSKVIYTSSNPAIASVDENGKVTGIKVGTVTITAEVNGAKADCKVTVKAKSAGNNGNGQPSSGNNGQTSDNNSNSSDNNNSNSSDGNNASKPSDSDSNESSNSNIVVSDPKLNKTSLTLSVNETFQFKVTGNTGSVKWSSSDYSVADIGSSGLVIGWKTGTATITAEVDGKKLTCKVTVKKVEKTASLSKKTLELINKERAKAGLSALTWDSRLEDAVKTRAIEASEKYSHTRPDGTRWSTVISNLSCSERSEIIAKRSSPSGVVAGWMDSESHKNAMLDSAKTYAAVGVYGNCYVCIIVAY